MIESAYYLVSKEIAIRCGLLNDRYRVKDGRYVLDNKDLSRIRFTPDEYINGLSGIEKTDEETATALIAANDYQMGEAGESEQTENTEAKAEEQQEENNETTEE